MWRWLLVSGFLVFSVVARAAPDVVPPAGSGTPAGNTNAVAGTTSSEVSAGIKIPDCDQVSRPPSGPGKVVAVTVNPSSRWQPRGGEVLVAITGRSEDLASLTVKGCFGWAAGNPDTIFSEEQVRNTFKSPAFTQVRPSERSGLINIGVIVPSDLPGAPSWFLSRFQQSYRAFAFGLIPAASMRLIGYNDKGVVFDVIKPVGITTVLFSVLFTTVVMGVLIGLLYRMSTQLARPAGWRPLTAIGKAEVQAFFRFRWVLLLIRTEDGRASLSSFQVLLWTTVVVASAIYVMSLSGELINIPDGTLVILGIAGGAKIITRYRPDGTQLKLGDASADPAWSDLIRPAGAAFADMANLQMLLFTLVCAGFVALQVITSYVIPEIPQGYQILMGITNGVYVGAKITKPGGAPDPAAP